MTTAYASHASHAYWTALAPQYMWQSAMTPLRRLWPGTATESRPPSLSFLGLADYDRDKGVSRDRAENHGALVELVVNVGFR